MEVANTVTDLRLEVESGKVAATSIAINLYLKVPNKEVVVDIVID